MKLLAVVLLLLPLSGCLAEVVDDFTVNCPQFFANPNSVPSPPTGFTGAHYKQICQTLNNATEYATFYDITNKIPVYSAYRFEGRKKCERPSRWKYIEPQLDDSQGGKNMASKTKVRNPGRNQALNDDYDSVKVNGRNKYDRGHLAPVYHANTQSCAEATFTLTNAAPQWPLFNSVNWRVKEKALADFLSTNCTNVGLRAYVVTGVVPGNTYMNNRVRVPSHYWTTYCCLDQNNKAKQSGGYIGDNVANATDPQYKTRQALETRLQAPYGKAFTLFGGRC